MSLRGFGFTYDCQGAIARYWYVGEDGVKRWADDDTPVDIPMPDSPETA